MKVTEVAQTDIFPAPRSGHRLVAVGDSLVLFGGYNERQPTGTGGEIKQEAWCFNVHTATWSLLTTDSENFPLSAASCAVIAYGSSIFVFGGSGASFGYSNSDQLYILDMKTLKWRVVHLEGGSIEGGYGHSISICNGYLYIYGGCDGFHYFNTMNKICLKQWHNTGIYRHGHEGRYRHESIEHDGKIMIFGGGCPTPIEDLGTIPYFCTKTETWHVMKAKSAHNPPGRVAHSCNKIAGYVIVTGGQAQMETMMGETNFALRDMWLFDLECSTWSPLQVQLPQGIFFHSGAVAGDHCLYTFGGSTYNDRGTVQRLNVLYKINFYVPSLVELAWTVFHEEFKHLSRLKMVEIGVPTYLIHRV